MDMATERIVTQISHDRRLTLHFKFEQYDRCQRRRKNAAAGRRKNASGMSTGHPPELPVFCSLGGRVLKA
jgi:hypothetical protein